INVLSMEDYLRGLGEVPSSWPLEAIKAQIVAARCYALTHLGSTALYDVDDTTQYQVYRGVDSESASQNAAVDQSSCQVLTHGGPDREPWRQAHRRLRVPSRLQPFVVDGQGCAVE